MYDLFKIAPDGKPTWLGPVTSLEDAKTKAKQQHASDPQCDFCVLEQGTGKIFNLSRSEIGWRSERTGPANRWDK